MKILMCLGLLLIFIIMIFYAINFFAKDARHAYMINKNIKKIMLNIIYFLTAIMFGVITGLIIAFFSKPN